MDYEWNRVEFVAAITHRIATSGFAGAAHFAVSVGDCVATRRYDAAGPAGPSLYRRPFLFCEEEEARGS